MKTTHDVETLAPGRWHARGFDIALVGTTYIAWRLPIYPGERFTTLEAAVAFAKRFGRVDPPTVSASTGRAAPWVSC